MQIPPLTSDERIILQRLADGGPSRDVPRPIRGRLALYGLINETTEGWVITVTGKEALTKPVSRLSDEKKEPVAVSTRRKGKRKLRNTPFL